MKHVDDVERRLHQAAEETRVAARQSVPPSLMEPERSRSAGWLVFAGAFALVVLAIGLLPMLTRSTEPGEVTQVPATSTTMATAATTAARATTSTAPATADCGSAAGMEVPGDQVGLPDQVADMRRALAEAAIACDFETMEQLASPELNTSFGGGGFDNLQRWEDEGTYPALALLVGIFDTPFATQEIEGATWYVWPSAFAYDTWDEIPAADLEALLTVYTEEELDQIAGFGSYAGWRIGITANGEWRFFVAGD